MEIQDFERRDAIREEVIKSVGSTSDEESSHPKQLARVEFWVLSLLSFVCVANSDASKRVVAIFSRNQFIIHRNLEGK